MAVSFETIATAIEKIDMIKELPKIMNQKAGDQVDEVYAFGLAFMLIDYAADILSVNKEKELLRLFKRPIGEMEYALKMYLQHLSNTDTSVAEMAWDILIPSTTIKDVKEDWLYGLEDDDYVEDYSW